MKSAENNGGGRRGRKRGMVELAAAVRLLTINLLRAVQAEQVKRMEVFVGIEKAAKLKRANLVNAKLNK